MGAAHEAYKDHRTGTNEKSICNKAQRAIPLTTMSWNEDAFLVPYLADILLDL